MIIVSEKCLGLDSDSKTKVFFDNQKLEDESVFKSNLTQHRGLGHAIA